MVYILIVVIGTPERHILDRNDDVFWRIFRKNPFRGVGCSELQEPQKALKTSPQMVRKIMYMGRKTPEGSAIKFGMPSDVHDVVPHANFCQDWSVF